MNIRTFTDNYDNTNTEFRSNYLSDVIRLLVESDDENSRYVIDELLVLLQDLEADDYFGTEGYRG